MNEKTCTKCGKLKLASEFGIKRWTKKDGTVMEALKSRCRACKNLTEKERINATPESRAHHSKLISEARKRRIFNMTPEQKEARRQLARKWCRDWRHANPDKVFAMKQKYRETHKEYVKTKKANDAKTPHGRALDKARHKRYYESHAESLRARGKDNRAALPDWYITAILRLPKGVEVPKWLIEVKRQIVKIKRELENSK